MANSNTYFCSDLHLFHDNVLKFDRDRGNKFKTMQEHNELIMNEIHALPEWAELYILWDIIWKMDEDSVKRMHDVFFAGIKCKLHWILGNHDYSKIRKDYVKYFDTVENYEELKYEWRKYILCHYPLLSWNGMHKTNGSFMLHWHDHRHGSFIEWNRYNIAYNGNILLWHIDSFITWAAKELERSISIVKQID